MSGAPPCLDLNEGQNISAYAPTAAWKSTAALPRQRCRLRTSFLRYRRCRCCRCCYGCCSRELSACCMGESVLSWFHCENFHDKGSLRADSYFCSTRGFPLRNGRYVPSEKERRRFFARLRGLMSECSRCVARGFIRRIDLLPRKREGSASDDETCLWLYWLLSSSAIFLRAWWERVKGTTSMQCRMHENIFKQTMLSNNTHFSHFWDVTRQI